MERTISIDKVRYNLHHERTEYVIHGDNHTNLILYWVGWKMKFYVENLEAK